MLVKISLFKCSSFFITSVAILKAHQGKGLGKRMMEAAEVWASERKYTYLHLKANKKGPVQFYQKLNYKPFDGLEVDLDFFDERHPAIKNRHFVKQIVSK